MIGTKRKCQVYQHEADGTYSLYSGEIVEYESGFQVSFVRPEAFEILSDEGWDIISAHLSAKLNSEPHIGVYNGTAEISFHSEDKGLATTTMETFNQESMLDWMMKSQSPTEPEKWFILNKFFNENKEVNYNEILKQISRDHSSI